MAGKKKKGVASSAIIIVVVVVLAVVTSVLINKRSFEPVVAGTSSINFVANDLDGKLRRLDEFKGKVIFLNLWATWCKPCEEEMPSMQRLYEVLKGRNFEMIALSVDSDGPEVLMDVVCTTTVLIPMPILCVRSACAASLKSGWVTMTNRAPKNTGVRTSNSHQRRAVCQFMAART